MRCGNVEDDVLLVQHPVVFEAMDQCSGCTLRSLVRNTAVPGTEGGFLAHLIDEELQRHLVPAGLLEQVTRTPIQVP